MGAARTPSRNRKGDAYAYCKRCHPGAIERRWTQELVVEAMLEWRRCYGRLPTSYDWSLTHARRRGGEALDRLSGGEWPSASVVTAVYGSWKAARAAAAEQLFQAGDGKSTVAEAPVLTTHGRAGGTSIADR